MDATKKETITSLLDINLEDERLKKNITEDSFFGFPLEPILKAEERLKDKARHSVAYFSMEYGLASCIYHLFKSKTPVGETNFIRRHEVFSNQRAMDYFHRLERKAILDIPIYSGGLGVLAGDTLKSAADLNCSVAGIGILWNKGYFKQSFWFKFGQIPEELSWEPHSYPGLIPTNKKFKIKLGEDPFCLKVWKYYVFSRDFKNAVPLLLLDSNCEENSAYQKGMTDMLYQSDNAWWKLIQRSILGIGGIKLLEVLGYKVNLHHLNEGHAALAAIEKFSSLQNKELGELRRQFAYTCHTPVSAGHDRFSFYDLTHIFNPKEIELIKKHGLDKQYKETVNFTELALNIAGQVNAVAKKHQEVTKMQFPKHKDRIQSITNGIHTHTWVSEAFAKLFDKYAKEIGNWQEDPKVLENILKLKSNPEFRKEIWFAHQTNKKHLTDYLRFWNLKEKVFTLAWARRIAPYKRPSLILQNPKALLEIAREAGPLQIIFAGKAHPADARGFAYVNDMLNEIAALEGDKDLIKIIFLENYDTYFGKLLTSNVDAWLNNPLPPFEASGTSGMKAILNGVIQISTLDGWIVEAQDKELGFIFGYSPKEGELGSEDNLRLREDSDDLYKTLKKVAKLYYDTVNHGKDCYTSRWIDLMINCAASSGHFSAQRMVEEYKQKIWSNTPQSIA